MNLLFSNITSIVFALACSYLIATKGWVSGAGWLMFASIATMVYEGKNK